MIESCNNLIFRPVQPLNGRQVEYYVENKPEPSEQRSFSWSLWRRGFHYHRCRSRGRDVPITVCSVYFFGLLNETNSNGPQRGQKMYVSPPPQNSIHFWNGLKTTSRSTKKNICLKICLLLNYTLTHSMTRIARGREALFQCDPPVTFHDLSSNFISPSPSHFSNFYYLNLWYPGESKNKTIVEQTHSNENETHHH